MLPAAKPSELPTSTGASIGMKTAGRNDAISQESIAAAGKTTSAGVVPTYVGESIMMNAAGRPTIANSAG